MIVAPGLARVVVAIALVAALAGCRGKSDEGAQLTVTVAGAAFGVVSSEAPPLQCSDRCELAVAPGSRVELHSTPTPDGVFHGWSGACSGDGDCIVAPVAQTAVDASFGPRPYPARVELVGEGGGTVQLPDGSLCSDQCEFTALARETIHLVAAARQDSYFLGWEGSCSGGSSTCDIAASDSLAVRARFGRKFRLEVTGIDANTKGVVLADPLDLNCGPICVAWFLPGQPVTLTANITDPLWLFRGWSDESCSSNTCSFVMDRDRTIDARFEKLHAWSHAFVHALDLDVRAAGETGWYLALESGYSQDFGSGVVPPKYKSYESLFLAGYGQGNVPSFIDVFGGQMLAVHHAMRASADGGVSLAMIAQDQGSPPSDRVLELGAATVTVPQGGRVKAFVDVSSDGQLVSAGELDPAVCLGFGEGVIESGASAFAWCPELSAGTTGALAKLASDWTSEWIASTPGTNVFRIVSGPVGGLWVSTPEIRPEMNCAGRPAPNGGLLQIKADGSCVVVWPYPATLFVFAFSAPGGAPLIDASYSTAFEFGGEQVPTPPAGLGYRGQLRFDAQGNPKWAHIAVQGGGSSGQTIKDAVQLQTGELVYAGSYSGVGELSPDTPDEAGSYLGVYSDQTGELLRAYTFKPPAKPANSTASFDHLELLGGGRIAVSGWFQGTFDFGGGPLTVPVAADNGFVAIYKF